MNLSDKKIQFLLNAFKLYTWVLFWIYNIFDKVVFYMCKIPDIFICTRVCIHNYKIIKVISYKDDQVKVATNSFKFFTNHYWDADINGVLLHQLKKIFNVDALAIGYEEMRTTGKNSNIQFIYVDLIKKELYRYTETSVISKVQPSEIMFGEISF